MARTAGDAPTGSGGRGRALSLKTHVLVLVAVFVAAAGVNVVYQWSAARHDARRSAVADAEFAAGIAARDIAAAVAVVRANVTTVAANPGLVRLLDNPADCALSFSGTGPFTTGHLDVVLADGSVVCTSLPPGGPRVYAGASWLTAALANPLAIGPVLDARTGKQVLVVSAPIAGRGMAVAILDLDAVGPALATGLGGPRQLEFLVTTPAGDTVLARSLDPDRWVGAPVAGTPFAIGADLTERRDVDGTPRLYGFGAVDGMQWRVYAGASRSQALAAQADLPHPRGQRSSWVRNG